LLFLSSFTMFLSSLVFFSFFPSVLLSLPCIQSLPHVSVHSQVILRQPHIRGPIPVPPPPTQTITTVPMAITLLRTEIRPETRLNYCRDLITTQHMHSVSQNLRAMYKPTI
jgi:hypothetical protein